MNAPAEGAAPVQPGDLIAGKYRVTRILGRGGMGLVVEAFHEALRERVALKFLIAPEMPPIAVERFLREAQSMVRIKNEHVVRVSDVGKHDNGAPYLVMELLEGSDLHRLIEQRGRIPTEEAVDWLLQACEGLAEAHRIGIVHRDLKPGNLFLTHRPGSSLIKILDFGVAKVLDLDSKDALTQTSQLLGSPLYMAPEQMRSARSVDLRADIWSLGVVLYQLLSGQAPFKAVTAHELFAVVFTEPPTPLQKHRPDLPQPLIQAVMRCLGKAPQERFSSVLELARALEAFGGPQAPARLARIEATLLASDRSYLSDSHDLPPSNEQQTIDPFSSGRSAAQSFPPKPVPARGKAKLIVGLVLACGFGVSWLAVSYFSSVSSPSGALAPGSALPLLSADSATPQPSAPPPPSASASSREHRAKDPGAP